MNTMNQEVGNVKSETFGSMLERLGAVISDTHEQVSISEKIGTTIAQTSSTLGFISRNPFAIEQVSGGSPSGAEPGASTLLQTLDALISKLGYANTRLQEVNTANDEVRSNLQQQLQ